MRQINGHCVKYGDLFINERHDRGTDVIHCISLDVIVSRVICTYEINTKTYIGAVRYLQTFYIANLYF